MAAKKRAASKRKAKKENSRKVQKEKSISARRAELFASATLVGEGKRGSKFVMYGVTCTANPREQLPSTVALAEREQIG